MQLSRRLEYALLALVDLAVAGRSERVQLRDIAARQAIPEKYLEQLLRPLRTAGVVVSTRGSRGGYELAREPAEIALLDVWEAVEGPLSGDEEPAPTPGSRAVRALWARLAGHLEGELRQVSLADLAEAYRRQRRTGDDWVI